jgi:transposase
VRRIGVDETSARRGHRYVTNVLDADTSGLLFMVEGRSAEALAAFAKALGEHGGQPSQIQAIAMETGANRRQEWNRYFRPRLPLP